MEYKLHILKKIVKVFNNNNITYSLGASSMLYLRGIVMSFNDLDFRVKSEDVPKIVSLFSNYPKEIRKPNEKYKTKVFLEYIIDGVEVDIMSDFIIQNNNKDYHFPLNNTDDFDIIKLDDVTIVLDSVLDWYTFYSLMNRTDKINILKSYLEK